jgi:hypothetical protein
VQSRQLLRRELAIGPGPEALGVDARERQAREPQNGEPGGVAQAMDLPVLPLFQHDLEPGLVTVEPEAPHLRGPGGAAVYLDALLPAVEGFVEDEAAHLGHVDLG